MQTVYVFAADRLTTLKLPDETTEVMPGVAWGAPDEFLTPAFWHVHGWQHQQLGTFHDLRLGRSLQEEVAACLLGGYGMPAELGLAAFARLRERRLLTCIADVAELSAALEEPFEIDGRLRHYRFPRQKARYVATSLTRLAQLAEPADDVDLRDQLMTLPGLGPKTASWVVRNCRDSDRVAVLDVHLVRAGRLIGLFLPSETPDRCYAEMEARYLRFAHAIDVPGRILDALIWAYMRALQSGRQERSEARRLSRREPGEPLAA